MRLERWGQQGGERQLDGLGSCRGGGGGGGAGALESLQQRHTGLLPLKSHLR